MPEIPPLHRAHLACHISALIWLVIWIVVIVLVIRWLRKGKKPTFSRRKKEQAPPPPANDTPENKQ